MSDKKEILNKCATECEEVVKRVTEDLIHKNSLFIAKQSDIATQHYEEQEKKFDSFLKAEDRRSTFMFYFNIFMWGVMLSVVGFVAIQSLNKAEKRDVLYIDDFRTVMKLNEKYNDARFLLKPEIPDSGQYHWYISTVLGRSVHKSGKISN